MSSRSIYLLVTLLASLPVTGGCSGGSSAGSGVLVQDSAGVTIVVNTSERVNDAPRWTLPPVPTREIGESPQYVLYRIGGLLLLNEGRLAVLNAGNHEVLILDESGNLLSRLGRQGDGPGEFSRPASLLDLPPDSIGVYDADHRRLTVYGIDGALIREVTLDAVPPGTQGRLLPLSTGDLVFFPEGGRIPRQAGAGVFRPVQEALLFGLDGAVRGSLGTVPGPAFFWGQYGQAVTGRVILGPSSHATTVDRSFVIGINEAPEFEVHEPDGTLSMIVRWPDHDRIVSEEAFAILLEAALARTPEPERPQARATLEAIPRSREYPPYDELLSAEAGEVWVATVSSPSIITRYERAPARHRMVFDRGGFLISIVETPRGFRPMAIGPDVTWGVFIDELGVESVRAYHLARS